MNLEILIEIIERIKPDYGQTVTQDSNLRELGLTSLDMMILLCELEQSSNIKIQFDKIKEAKTVEQLYCLITKK